MKIVHVITGLGNGGAEAVLYRLCTADKANTHAVISLHDGGKYGDALKRGGIDVHCLELSNGRLMGRGVSRLIRLIRDLRPDVVQTWMYHGDFFGGLAARIAGHRNICWGLHNSNLDARDTRRSTHLIARTNSLLSRWIPSRIISCSERASRLHKAMGYSAERFVVIPNGYDLTQFAPDEPIRRKLRAEWRIPEDTPLLGMIARFYPQKDHPNLMAALGHLKRRGYSFRCALAGNGTTRSSPDLVQLIREHDLEREMLLLGPRTDIPAIMSALDMHVLSSAYGEAFPNVLNEAMASGTPCITTDLGDAALIVGEHGWIVPPRDPVKLGNALIEAVNESSGDPERWQRRCEGARRRIAQNFTIEEMVRRYTQVWEDIASSGTVRRRVSSGEAE